MGEAAEEVGLGLIVLPRCPGVIPRALTERLEGDGGVELLHPWQARTVPWMEQSPVILMWEREMFWLPLPGATRPTASVGAPKTGDRPVAVAHARYGRRVEVTLHPEGPGGWINEIVPVEAANDVATPPATVNEFVRGWVADNLGLVLPPLHHRGAAHSGRRRHRGPGPGVGRNGPRSQRAKGASPGPGARAASRPALPGRIGAAIGGGPPLPRGGHGS